MRSSEGEAEELSQRRRLRRLVGGSNDDDNDDRRRRRGGSIERVSTMAELQRLQRSSTMADENGIELLETTSLSSLSTVHDDDNDNAAALIIKDNDEDPTACFDPLLDLCSEDNDSKVVEQQQQVKVGRKELDVTKYMERREMTAFQERCNALTMIPSPLWCLCYILNGNWIPNNDDKGDGDVRNLVVVDKSLEADDPLSSLPHDCIDSTWFPRLHALPPWPILLIALGIILHAPFSFIYHWCFGSKLNATQRSLHWSRRMDQSFIHVCSALVSFATSGSWPYFLGNIVFNADCIYRQFLPTVRPRRNQARIGISIVLYMAPLWKRGLLELFCKAWAVILVSSWFFVTYPLKGWSHTAFHLLICFLPPLLMEAARDL
jgi:hypothetical protein